MLSRFNNGHPLNKDIITKIEDFFDYSWNNNRLNGIKSAQDLRFMDELPESVQGAIIIDYLFSDFLIKYEGYFLPSKRTNKDKKNVERIYQEIYNSQNE